MRLLKLITLVVVAALAVLIAWQVQGESGVYGSLFGLLLGAVMVSLSYLMARQMRRNPAQTHVYMIFGIGGSFVLLIVWMIVVGALAPPLSGSGALTALALYMAYRVFEVSEVTRDLQVRRVEGES